MHRGRPCFPFTDSPCGNMCFTLCAYGPVLLSAGDSAGLVKAFDGRQNNLPLGGKSNIWAFEFCWMKFGEFKDKPHFSAPVSFFMRPF